MPAWIVPVVAADRDFRAAGVDEAALAWRVDAPLRFAACGAGRARSPACAWRDAGCARSRRSTARITRGSSLSLRTTRRSPSSVVSMVCEVAGRTISLTPVRAGLALPFHAFRLAAVVS